MKHIRQLVLICSLAFCASSIWAYQPMIHKVLIDSTSSVSDADFAQMNKSVAVFAELLYQRSQLHPGQAAEWVSVSWFGGPQEYESTIFINCSDHSRILMLQQMLLTKQHPHYSSTAIYTSTLYGTIQCIQQDDALPYNYFKDIVLITDGDDNSSLQDHKTAFSRLYPNNTIFLFMLAVGNSANLASFRSYATQIVPIRNYGDLIIPLQQLSEIL